MCSIYGATSIPIAKHIKEKTIHRGKDAQNIIENKGFFIGHNLLAINNFKPQPIVSGNLVLATNSEIYNLKEIKDKYNINGKNDSEVLFKLLNKLGIKKTLEIINAEYAFCYAKDSKLYLARDIIGIRPLWYMHHKDIFLFSSEKSAIPSKYQKYARALNPRNILEYDILENKTNIILRDFFDYIKEENIKYLEAKKEVKKLLDKSIKLRGKTDKKTGLLLSSGVDSTYIAKILENKNIICYNVSFRESKDYKKLKEIENTLNCKIKYIKPSLEEIEDAIPKVCKIIESSDPIKVAIALTFYFASIKAKEDGIKVMLTGSGADDIFAGYSRFKENYNIKLDTLSRLRQMYENDNYRDDKIFMAKGIELRVPYLDTSLIKYTLSLKDEFKIKSNVNKRILRDIAKDIIPQVADRKKSAAQYGSGIQKALIKISKKNGFKSIGSYLKQFAENSITLASLYSGGKDSYLALETMHSRNYNINCLITIKSKNKDSYMFHTPLINETEKHAKSMNISYREEITYGEKERELKALRSAILSAIEQHNVGAVITGALYSNYQRERVEKICDELGVAVYSPLWHIEQTKEIKEIVNRGIKAKIIKIAGMGLDFDDLGKIIDDKLIEKLEKLEKKLGYNTAGEGGEYETLVIDAPLFEYPCEPKNAKKLKIDEYTSELILDN